MNFKAKIIFKYVNSHYANIVYKSLYPDNEGFVESYVDDSSLVCVIEGENIATVSATIDDLIHCEKIIEATSEISIKGSK